MRKQEILIYDDGAEFIDDIFSDDIPTDLNEREFYDYIYNDVTTIGHVTIKNREYVLYEVGSSDALYALKEAPYNSYLKWREIIENL